jgi:hypothetical protein
MNETKPVTSLWCKNRRNGFVAVHFLPVQMILPLRSMTASMRAGLP